MKKICPYTLRHIRDLKNSHLWPIWKVLPIKKCWIGSPTMQYVIWWDKKILDYADTYQEAIKKRREIWNLA